MIISGLASVIIGEVIFRPKGILTALIAVVLGSIVYRMAILIALRSGFAPTDLKIVTAILVILALSTPALKDQFATFRRRRAAVAAMAREVKPPHAPAAARPKDI